MALIYLLLMLSIGLSQNIDIEQRGKVRSFHNKTSFNYCGSSTTLPDTSSLLTTTPLISTPELTSTSSTVSTSTIVPPTSSTVVSIPVDWMTSSTVPPSSATSVIQPSSSSEAATSFTMQSTSAGSTVLPPSTTVDVSSSHLSTSPTSSTEYKSTLTTVISTEETIFTTDPSSTGFSSSSEQKTTATESSSSSPSPSSSSSLKPSSPSIGARTTPVTTGKATSPSLTSSSKSPSTSRPSPTTVSLLSILSSSSAFSVPQSSSSSSSTVITGSSSTPSSTSSQRPTSATETSSTLSTGGVTTPEVTTTTTEKPTTVTATETKSFPSTTSSGASSTRQEEITSTATESTKFLSSEYPSFTLTSTVGSSVTTSVADSTEGWTTERSTEGSSTEFGTETNEKTSSTTTVTSTEGSTLFSTTDPTQMTTYKNYSTAPSTETESTQSISPAPTTRQPPIPERRTPPGQGQQHPATSTELPETTGKGTTEKVILDGRRTAAVEKKTTVTLPVSMATTLKEILSGRRWVTPVRPVVPTTPAAPALIPTSTQFVETSGSVMSTGIPSTVGSKKPTTPWELPTTTTAKIILNGRRFRTPEKNGLEKMSTVTSTESGKTTDFTVDTTGFAPGNTETTGKPSTRSSSASFGTTKNVEIPSSSPTSIQATSSRPLSSSSQSSETTSPVLNTTEMVSLTSDKEIVEETTVLPPVQTTESTKVTSTMAPSTEVPSSTLGTTVEKETTQTSQAAVEPITTTAQGETSTPGTTRKLTIGHDETTVTQTTAGTTTITDGQSTSSKGPMATEMKDTTIGPEKTASGRKSTTEKLEVTSLPFSSAPWTTSEPATSSTSSQRPGTKPPGTTAGQTTLKPTPAYGQGCQERCPQGTLSGSGRCYQLVPVAYQPKFHTALSFCARNRTGHLMEPAELMKDILIVRPWLTTFGYDVKNLSVYLGPFKSEGNKIYGMYTNLSRVSVELAPVETIKMSEVRNFVGICVNPEFCSTFNCSFAPLYDSLPGMLESPMPEPVIPGTTVKVQCLSPSNTVIQLRCDSFGMMTPRPGTPPVTCKISRSFNREKPVSDNKPVREECDCNEQGTETCDAVEGGFKCSCKRNWLKHTCWKSDDACWVPSNHPDKCNGKGTCHSYPDQYVCQCEAGFGGKNCRLPVNNCTWFGGPDSTPFFNAGKVAIVTVTSLEFMEFVLKVLIKCAALISTDGPTDPLSYTNAVRKYSVGVAGVLITAFGHPNFFFTLYGFGARLVFLLVNVLMLWAFWMLIIEAYVTFCVYFGIGRNRWTLGVEKAKEDNWCESEEPKDRWFLTKTFMVYPGMIFAIVIELAIFSWFYHSIPSPYTCIGEISSLRSPATIINLILMAMMAFIAAGIGFFSQVAKWFYPDVIAEQRSYFEFHKGRVAIEILNKVERCQWLQPIQAPVVFATYALAVWSQDQVATGLEQTLEFYLSIPIIVCSVLISAVGVVSYSSWLYGHVMKFVLPRLPWLKIWTVYTPAEHGYLNHEEVINRKEGKGFVLPENRDWPSHPSEKSYVSLERRHQCERRLTRQYMEMRLMGVGKEDARELISARFTLAIPEGDPEEEQWTQLLREWSEAVATMDTTIFEIPRNPAMTRTEYWERIMNANLFTRADVMRENSDWMRFLLIFQAMGHIPLEEPEFEGHFPQIKHVLQTPEYQSAWERISRQGNKKSRRKMRKIAQKLSPELFPNAKKIKKLRAKARQPHTVLVNLPGVRRYLTVDFLNRLFFVSEQARFRHQEMKGQEILEPREQKIEKIQIKVLKRRVVPQAITLTNRGEWLAGADLITMKQPKAAALIGGNDQPRKVKSVPPLVGEAIEIPAGVIEHNGYPLSIFRW